MSKTLIQYVLGALPTLAFAAATGALFLPALTKNGTALERSDRGVDCSCAWPARERVLWGILSSSARGHIGSLRRRQPEQQ